jgi:hypothetical protein
MWYFCEICQHFHMRRRHPRAEILFGIDNGEGDIIMAEEQLDVDLSTQTATPVVVYASLGNLYDGPSESGNIVTDTVTAATYSVTDETVATVASQDGVGNATFDLTGTDGETLINVGFTTASGATGTGVGKVTVSGSEPAPGGGGGGPAVSVHIDLSLTPPAPAAPPAA